MKSAEFCKIFAGGNPQFGGKRLNQHRHQVTGHNHPEQRVSIFSPTLDIGGEIPRIDIRNTGDKAGPRNGKSRANPRFLLVPESTCVAVVTVVTSLFFVRFSE